jgi:hypothetical protein
VPPLEHCNLLLVPSSKAQLFVLDAPKWSWQRAVPVGAGSAALGELLCVVCRHRQGCAQRTTQQAVRPLWPPDALRCARGARGGRRSGVLSLVAPRESLRALQAPLLLRSSFLGGNAHDSGAGSNALCTGARSIALVDARRAAARGRICLALLGEARGALASTLLLHRQPLPLLASGGLAHGRSLALKLLGSGHGRLLLLVYKCIYIT